MTHPTFKTRIIIWDRTAVDGQDHDALSVTDIAEFPCDVAEAVQWGRRLGRDWAGREHSVERLRYSEEARDWVLHGAYQPSRGRVFAPFPR